MCFDLFRLHFSEEDQHKRELLRIYSIIQKHSHKSNEKNIRAEEIVKILRAARTKLNNQFGFSWQKQWLAKIGFGIKHSSPKDWFAGRASIPIIAIKKLEEFGCEKEVSEIMKISKYFGSTTGKVVIIPKEINEDLAYLAGAILCDGHLKKDDYRIFYELTEKRLVEKFQKLSFCEREIPVL